ncbi:MAG: methyl-accepting chemotaxis protein [Candidatus Nitrospinota bacterium M3_3B_026]
MARPFFSTISGKFMLPLVGALVLLYFFVQIPWIQSEMRSLAEESSRRFALNTADLVLDALNTMMLTGEVRERRDIFIKKLNSWDQVREARLFRSPLNEKQFPALGDHDRPADEIDKEVIKTRRPRMEVVEEEEGGARYLRAVVPFIARENYHGTRCMDCHEVKAGDVLGALSLELDLRPAESAIASFKRSFVAFNAVIVLLIIVLLYLALKKLIVKPIVETTERMHDIVEGEGDLTRRLTVHGNDELADLARAFNLFIDRIRRMISRVAELSETVAGASAETTISSEQIARGVKSQSEQINNNAYVMKEITSTVENIAANADRSAAMSRNVMEDANSGMDEVRKSIGEMRLIDETVKHSVDNIGALSESSRRIGEIINVIDYIADQTNLLALNASIEAARAGEQGLGFSVVADEIRKLAERTTRATKEVAQMIEAIQSEAAAVVESMKTGAAEVVKGVEMSDKAGEALRKIVESVEAVNDQINQIAASVEQQSVSIKSISDSVSSMDQIGHETATGAEETARAANDLNIVAMELDNLVKKFKI